MSKMQFESEKDKWRVLDLLADRLDRNVEGYCMDNSAAKDVDYKYGAYAICRLIEIIDSEVGSEAVAYLRDNGL
jgi:hypothetical protein